MDTIAPGDLGEDVFVFADNPIEALDLGVVQLASNRREGLRAGTDNTPDALPHR